MGPCGRAENRDDLPLATNRPQGNLQSMGRTENVFLKSSELTLTNRTPRRKVLGSPEGYGPHGEADL